MSNVVCRYCVVHIVSCLVVRVTPSYLFCIDVEVHGSHAVLHASSWFSIQVVFLPSNLVVLLPFMAPVHTIRGMHGKGCSA